MSDYLEPTIHVFRKTFSAIEVYLNSAFFFQLVQIGKVDNASSMYMIADSVRQKDHFKLSGSIKHFHKHAKLVIMPLMPTLYSHVFAVFFVIDI